MKLNGLDPEISPRPNPHYSLSKYVHPVTLAFYDASLEAKLRSSGQIQNHLLAVAVFSMALGQLMLLSVLLTPAGSSLSNTDALNEARSWTIVIGGVLIAAANGAALALMPTLLVALFLTCLDVLVAGLSVCSIGFHWITSH